MKIHANFFFISLCWLTLLFSSCTTEGDLVLENEPLSTCYASRSSGFIETFESASKGSYADGYINKYFGGWYLEDALIGSLSSDCFQTDTSLPGTFFEASVNDYTNSGFDQGHLCSSADRDKTEASNENTYYMINIASQVPISNQSTKVGFENYLRSLTHQDHGIHIVSRVYFIGSYDCINNSFVNQRKFLC